jgi:putative nucleotidyltransferase with HDIG domain
MDRMASMSQEMFIRSVRSLVEALDARDPYTRSHSRNVTHFATGIARKMNLASEQLSLIRRAAIVHDIGKIGIPDSILRKPGSLSETERSRMEDHVIIGVRILDQLHTMNDELPIVRSHHERMDGQGYPYGLAGDEIPIGGRILCVADAFDAITSNRVYRPARSIARAIEALTSEQGKQFDVDVINALLEWIGDFGDPEKLTVTDMLAAKTNASVA